MRTTDYTAGEKYRELLRNQIRATGDMLIADADKIVRNLDYMTNLEIVMRFENETCIPTIEVISGHINVYAFDEVRKQKEESKDADEG